MTLACKPAMKLRIHSNSLRFRFDKQEVEALAKGHAVEACIQLGPTRDHNFAYRVVPIPGANFTSQIRFENQTLTILVPGSALASWFAGPELTIAFDQSWPEASSAGPALHVSLEKDMQRLNSKPGEPLDRLYPNPQFGKVRCSHP